MCGIQEVLNRILPSVKARFFKFVMTMTTLIHRDRVEHS